MWPTSIMCKVFWVGAKTVLPVNFFMWGCRSQHFENTGHAPHSDTQFTQFTRPHTATTLWETIPYAKKIV